jgi:hypothetical protein
MGIATRLGPWLLGTVKDTTGTTAGTIRNVGATTATQTSRLFTFTDTTATQIAVLPAGAMITDISFQPLAQFTGGSNYTVFINGTAAGNRLVSSVGIGATVRGPVRPGAGDGSDSFTSFDNVGPVDAIIFAALGGTPTAGSGRFVITYIVRNPDGSTT